MWWRLLYKTWQSTDTVYSFRRRYYKDVFKLDEDGGVHGSEVWLLNFPSMTNWFRSTEKWRSCYIWKVVFIKVDCYDVLSTLDWCRFLYNLVNNEQTKYVSQRGNGYYDTDTLYAQVVSDKDRLFWNTQTHRQDLFGAFICWICYVVI